MRLNFHNDFKFAYFRWLPNADLLKITLKYSFGLLAFLASGSLFSQLDFGLFVHYPLNGTAQDISGNDFHGTPFDAVWGANSFMEVDGALVSNGNSTFIDMPDSPILKPQFPITVSVRANFFAISGQQIIFTNDFATATHSGIWFQLATSGAFVASFGNAQGGFNVSTRHAKAANYTIETNTWYVITAIFRGPNDIDIYINCELVSGTYSGNAASLGYTDAPGSLCRKYANPIGSGLPPEHFNGSIHDFRMWDRELEEEEILLMCATGCTGQVATISETFCEGVQGLIEVVLTDINEEVLEINWSIETLGNFQGVSVNLTFNTAGVYLYSLNVSTASGCTYEYNGELTVLETIGSPVLPADIAFCEGTVATLDLTAYIDNFDISIEGGPTVIGPLFSFPAAGTYTFNFESNCGSYSIDVEVEEGAASISLEMPNEACVGHAVDVLIPGWTVIAGEVDLTIDFGNGTVLPVNNMTMSTIYTSPGSFTVSVNGFIGDCEASGSHVISVIEGLPDFNLIPTAAICQGQSFVLDFSSLNFVVVNGQGNSVESFETTVGGVYGFTALGACGNVEQTVSITVIPFNPQPIGILFELCPNRDTLHLSFANQQYMFQWSTGATLPSIDVTIPGTYVVGVTDSTGTCSEDYTFKVQATTPFPQEVFPNEVLVLCEEGHRTIHPLFIGVPYTFPDGTVGFSYQVQESGTIELLYSDLCYEYVHQLEVELKECLCPMWVPNVFSPNSDGLNDFFLPVVDCPVDKYRLEILNRWGQLVFETDDVQKGWNGSFNGGSYFCPEGVYIYMIHYVQYLNQTAIPKALTGHLTLVR